MPARVLLVLPPIPRGPVYPLAIEHLGLCALATSLRRHGCSCRLLDGFFLGLGRVDFIEELCARIEQSGCDIVGFSIMAEEFLEETLRAATLVKQRCPEIVLMAGGPYPTFRPEALLRSCPALDVALRGEADETIVEFVRGVEEPQRLQAIPGLVWRDGAAIRHGPFPFSPPVLDNLPEPARDFAFLSVARHGALSMSTSRGCSFRCQFCGIPGFSGSRRERSAAAVVAEIVRLFQEFRPERITFVDPTFIGPGDKGRERFVMIGRQLADLRLPIRYDFEVRSSQVERESFTIWKEAGLDRVHLGLESGFPATLKRFRKGETIQTNAAAIEVLREIEIGVTAGFIMFHPWTTLAEVRANVEFLAKHRPDNILSPLLNCLRMYAGVPLAETWTGQFLPRQGGRGYFLSRDTQMFFDRLTAASVIGEFTADARNGAIDRLFDRFSELLNEAEARAADTRDKESRGPSA